MHFCITTKTLFAHVINIEQHNMRNRKTENIFFVFSEKYSQLRIGGVFGHPSLPSGYANARGLPASEGSGVV